VEQAGGNDGASTEEGSQRHDPFALHGAHLACIERTGSGL
jgi:hypothetical protein